MFKANKLPLVADTIHSKCCVNY